MKLIIYVVTDRIKTGYGPNKTEHIPIKYFLNESEAIAFCKDTGYHYHKQELS